MQKLIKTREGNLILQGSVCPFRNPLILPSPTIAGQLTIQNIPCSNSCPHFEQVDNEVKISCSGYIIYKQVEIENEKEQESKLTLK